MKQTKRNNTNMGGRSERKVTKKLKTYLKIQWLKTSQIWGRSKQILNRINLHRKSMEGHAITKSQNLRKKNLESSESKVIHQIQGNLH